ncbi:YceI family protein [Streptomyces bathyalis]|uniref:YceI family protein n=1 Tax=Streptomyces bathyalis TaxID=2710756 RepID=A0A7T1T9I8_9ACTN|nr:YceI family protein [Streptomyces bathyalis]QPP08896.1 YceI family protein [Streptomyces bathyalis]
METEQERSRTAPRAPRAGRYEIDTGSSVLEFTTRHVFGLLPVRGTFAIRAGTVDVTEPLAASRIHAEIAAAGFDTGNRSRDAAVRSRRFLDADRHPLITFDADALEETADGARITGTLTASGVSTLVSLTAGECTVTPRGFTVRATARVDRKDFGVTASPGMAGRHLDVVLRIRCVQV